ncbi:Non-catalytic module family DOC2, partial [Piromyces sp. E2]
CFASSLGYPCCSEKIQISYSDSISDWGIEDDQWCGIGGQKKGNICGNFACCEGCDVIYIDSDGKWGIENGRWCVVKD